MEALTVFYWRGSAEVRSELIVALAADGFQVKELRNLEEVLDSIARGRPDLIIVDASAGEREASSRIVELSSTGSLYEIPSLFLSVQAEKRTLPLDGKYRQLLPIDVPFQVGDVIAVIRRALMIHSTPVPPTADVQKVARNEFIVRPSHLPSKPGGRRFAFAITAEDLPDDEVIRNLAASGELGKMLQNFSLESEWLSMHAKRSSQLSASLSKLLPSGHVESRNVQTASLCFNWGFLEKGASLQRLDLFLHGLEGVGREFAQCVHKSAQLASEHIGERAQRTLLAIGAMLERAPIEEELQLVREAELALAVELAGRACWRMGYWSPHGAYRAMRKLQSGEPLAFDKEISWTLLRALADAALNRPTVENFFKPRVDEDGLPIYMGSSTLSESFEATIPISVVDLLPGMRLAQNLLAKDGAVVLEAMTELDEDLICRIWRLLALRPLSHPVAVAAKLINQ